MRAAEALAGRAGPSWVLARPYLEEDAMSYDYAAHPGQVSEAISVRMCGACRAENAEIEEAFV